MTSKILLFTLWLILLGLACKDQEDHVPRSFVESDYDNIPTTELENLESFISQPRLSINQPDITNFRIKNIFLLISKCRRYYKQNDISAFAGFFNHQKNLTFREKLTGYNKLERLIGEGNLKGLFDLLPVEKDDALLPVKADTMHMNPFRLSSIKKDFLINRDLISELIKSKDDFASILEKLLRNFNDYEAVEKKSINLYRFLKENPYITRVFSQAKDITIFSELYYKLEKPDALSIQRQLLSDYSAVLLTKKETKKLNDVSERIIKGINIHPLVAQGWLKELTYIRRQQEFVNNTINYNNDDFIDINKKPGSVTWLRIYFGDSLIQEINRSGKIRKVNGELALMATEHFISGDKDKTSNRPIPLGITVTNLSIAVSEKNAVYALNNFAGNIELSQFINSGFSKINYDDNLTKFSDNYIKDIFSNVHLKRISVDFDKWDASFINGIRIPSFFQTIKSASLDDEVVFNLSEINSFLETETLKERIYRSLARKIKHWGITNKHILKDAIGQKIKDAKVISIENNNDSLTTGSVIVAVPFKGKTDTITLEYTINDGLQFSEAQEAADLTAGVFEELKKEIIQNNEKRFDKINDWVNRAAANAALTNASVNIKWNPSDGIYIEKKNGKKKAFTENTLEDIARIASDNISNSSIQLFSRQIETNQSNPALCDIIVSGQSQVDFFGLPFKVTGALDCVEGIFTAQCDLASDFAITVKFSGDQFQQVIDYDRAKLLEVIKVRTNDFFKKARIPFIEIADLRLDNNKITASALLTVKDFNLHAELIDQFELEYDISFEEFKKRLNIFKEGLTEKINSFFNTHISKIQINYDKYGSLALKELRLVDLADFKIKGSIDFSLKKLCSFNVDFTYSYPGHFGISTDILDALKNFVKGKIPSILEALNELAGMQDAADIHFTELVWGGQYAIKVDFKFRIDMFIPLPNIDASVIFFLEKTGREPIIDFKPDWASLLRHIEIPIGPVTIYDITPKADFSAKKFSLSCRATFIKKETGEIINAYGETILDVKKKTFTIDGKLQMVRFKILRSQIFVDAENGIFKIHGDLEGKMTKRAVTLSTDFIVQINAKGYNDTARVKISPDDICDSSDLFAFRSSGSVKIIKDIRAINAIMDVTIHVKKSGMTLEANGKASFLSLAELDCKINAGLNFEPSGISDLVDLEIEIIGKVQLGFLKKVNVTAYGELKVRIGLKEVKISLLAEQSVTLLCGAGAGITEKVEISIFPEELIELSLDALKAQLSIKFKIDFPNLWDCLDFCIFDCGSGNGDDEEGKNPDGKGTQTKNKDPLKGTGPINQPGDNPPNPGDIPNGGNGIDPTNLDLGKPGDNKEPGNNNPNPNVENGTGTDQEELPTFKPKEKKKKSKDNPKYDWIKPGDVLVVSIDNDRCKEIGVQPTMPTSNQLTECSQELFRKKMGLPLNIFERRMGAGFPEGSIKKEFIFPQNEEEDPKMFAYDTPNGYENYFEDFVYYHKQGEQAGEYCTVVPAAPEMGNQKRFICRPLVRFISDIYFTDNWQSKFFRIDTQKTHSIGNEHFILTKPYEFSPTSFVNANLESNTYVFLYYINKSNEDDYIQFAIPESKISNWSSDKIQNYCFIQNHPIYLGNTKTSKDLLMIYGKNGYAEFFPVTAIKEIFYYPELTFEDTWNLIQNESEKNKDFQYTIKQDEFKSFIRPGEDFGKAIRSAFNINDIKFSRFFNFKSISNNKEWLCESFLNDKVEIYSYYSDVPKTESLILGIFDKNNPSKLIDKYLEKEHISQGLQLFNGPETDPEINNDKVKKANSDGIFSFIYKLNQDQKNGFFLLNCNIGQVSFLVQKEDNNSHSKRNYYKYEIRSNKREAAKNEIYLTGRLNWSEHDKHNYSEQLNILKENHSELQQMADGSMAGMLLIDEANNRIYSELNGKVKLRWGKDINTKGLSVDMAKFVSNFIKFSQKGNYKLSGLPMTQLKRLFENPEKFTERAELIFSVFDDWEKNSRSKINPWSLFRTD